MPLIWLLAIGDSKTVGVPCCAAQGGYRDPLIADLNALGTNEFRFLTPAYAVSGTTADATAAVIQSYLDGFVEAEKVPAHVLINLGANDLGYIANASINQAAWVADMGVILDAVHAKWPTAHAYLMRIYNSNFPTEQDLYDDTWIPAVLVGREAWASVGPDERTFLPGNMADGAHPNATGYDITAAEWQTVIGY